MKRVLSLVLTLVMLASMVTVPVVAESSMDIQLGFANGECDESGCYTIDVVASAGTETFALNRAQIYVSFDKTVLQLKDRAIGDIPGVDDVLYDMDDVDSANERGVFSLVIVDSEKNNHTVTSGKTKLVTLHFAEVDGVESCKTELGFAVSAEDEHNVLGYCETGEDKTYSLDETATKTVAVKGTDPVLAKVSFDRVKVTADGDKTVTVQASAYSKRGTIITDRVEWSVAVPEAASANDVTIDANGKITVDAKAVAGDYTVTATPKGEGFCTGEETKATLTVERLDSIAKSIVVKRDGRELSNDTDAINIPGDGADANVYTYTVAMKNQYGENFDGKVEWEWKTVSGTGDVSFDEETGTLTVPSGVSADAVFTLTAKSGDVSKVINITTETDIQLGFDNGRWNGDIYTVDVVASAGTETFALNRAQIYVSFDKTVLQLKGSEIGDIPGVDDVLYDMDDVDSANERGIFSLIIVDSEKNNHTVTSEETKFVTLQFAKADGVESCKTELSFSCAEGEHNVLGYHESDNDKNYSLNDTATVSVDVVGVAPKLDSVTLGKTEVAVDGENAVSVQADAFSERGTKITGLMKWSVDDIPDGAFADDVTIDENGKITVDAKAVAGTYTVTATPLDEELCTGELVSVVLTVKRTAARLASFTISGEDSVAVDQDGKNVRESYGVVNGLDQFGSAYDITGAEVSWSVSEAKGVSFDEDNKLVVKPEAAAGTVTVTAKIGDVTATKEVTITKAAPVAKSIVVLRDGKELTDGIDTVNIPTEGTNVYTYTAVIKDQYGEVYTGEVTWEFSGAVSGMPFDQNSGKLTVTPSAVKDAEVTLIAKCGSVSKLINITAKDFMPPVMDNDEEYEDVTGATIKESVPNGDGTASIKLEIPEPPQDGLTYLVWVVKEDGGELAGAGKVGATYTVPQDSKLQVFIEGDSDTNGIVDVSDAADALLIALNHKLNTTYAKGLELVINDIDSNGILDTTDAADLLIFALELKLNS